MENSVVRSEFWPEPSAHRSYWERHNCAYVYEYDPADDGPEAEIGKAVLATHTPAELKDERLYTIASRCIDAMISWCEYELARRRAIRQAKKILLI